MIRRIVVSAVCLIVATCAFAQTTPPPDVAKKSEEILSKITKLDMLNFLLPLAMTNEQFNKLLPTVEKIRVLVRKVQEAEAETLRQLEAEIDASLKDATDKGLVPKKELRDKLGATFKALGKRRQLSIAINTDLMYDALKEIWNAGQMKVAADSLNPKDYDPNVKVEEMTTEQKVRIFVREIMLNPEAYGVMVEMSKKK
jgi:hypothetical protein